MFRFVYPYFHSGCRQIFHHSIICPSDNLVDLTRIIVTEKYNRNFPVTLCIMLIRNCNWSIGLKISTWNFLKRHVLEDNGWPFENYELWCYCGSTLLRVCSSNLSKTNIQKYFNHFNVSMCLKQTTLALYNVIEMIMIPTYLWIIRKILIYMIR